MLLDILLLFALPIVFILGIYKKIRFWYITLAVWVLKDLLDTFFEGVFTPIFLGKNDIWAIYNGIICLIFLCIVILGFVLYAKTYPSAEEAFGK